MTSDIRPLRILLYSTVLKKKKTTEAVQWTETNIHKKGARTENIECWSFFHRFPLERQLERERLRPTDGRDGPT